MASSGLTHLHMLISQVISCHKNLHLISCSPQNVLPTSLLKSHCCGHPKYPIPATLASASAPQGDASPPSALSAFHPDFLVANPISSPHLGVDEQGTRDDLKGNAKNRHREDNTMDRHGDRHPPPGLLCAACVFCNMHGRKPISCCLPCSCWHQRVLEVSH